MIFNDSDWVFLASKPKARGIQSLESQTEFLQQPLVGHQQTLTSVATDGSKKARREAVAATMAASHGNNGLVRRMSEETKQTETRGPGVTQVSHSDSIPLLVI